MNHLSENLADTAAARSQLFQLLALAFVHPVEEFHRVLVNGSYPLALSRAAFSACGIDTVVGQPQNQYTDYEAAYIHLFQVGKRGQPIVNLNAGDYKDLLGSGSRPEFLLEYSGWYRHFGLKTNEDDQANEFPDHIVCQFELLAWLAHLENNAAEKPELQYGYQRAQRDFCQRHLQQFLELLVTALNSEQSKSQDNPYFFTLASLALEAVTTIQVRLEKALGEAAGQFDNPDQIASVNLWG
jgi:DMSO reductase family type II enzyme chaperone